MSPLQLYYQMYRIRKVEIEIANRYHEGEMRCPVHLSVGQEGAAVGVAACLTKDDLMVSTHRGHAHYLAKGGSLRGLICELYGKEPGCSRGYGGSMHLVDRDCGFYGSTSIVGGTIPVGVGLAFAKKLKKEKGVVAVCLGDAAVESGVFHEAANFASLHKLAVIFVLENNFYSCYTHLSERQPDRSFSRIADAHALSYLALDGNNASGITSTLNTFLREAEKMPELFPLLLDLETYRHLEHCGPNEDDHLGYRDPDEVKLWKEHDPLIYVLSHLKDCGVEPSDTIIDSINKEIEFEFQFAKAAPFPSITEIGSYEYSQTN